MSLVLTLNINNKSLKNQQLIFCLMFSNKSNKNYLIKICTFPHHIHMFRWYFFVDNSVHIILTYFFLHPLDYSSYRYVQRHILHEFFLFTSSFSFISHFHSHSYAYVHCHSSCCCPAASSAAAGNSTCSSSLSSPDNISSVSCLLSAASTPATHPLSHFITHTTIKCRKNNDIYNHPKPL